MRREPRPDRTRSRRRMPRAPASTNYTITYTPATLSVTFAFGACQGAPGRTILNPINPDGSSVFKQKSTVPAKFRVCDANGNSVGLPGTVTGFGMILSSSGTYSEANEAPDSTTPDTAFRWSPTDQQWIFNVSTKTLAAQQDVPVQDCAVGRHVHRLRVRVEVAGKARSSTTETRRGTEARRKTPDVFLGGREGDGKGAC